MQIHSVGIDLGNTIFHLVALGAAGKVPSCPIGTVGHFFNTWLSMSLSMWNHMVDLAWQMEY
ncbi:MAG: hypothetical protein WDN23_11400 [Edaphobacter sp.]